MEKTKMTYVQALETVLTGAPLTEEVTEKLTALKATLEKRAAAPRKPRKEDPEKAAFRQTVLEFVVDSTEAMRATDVAKALEVSVQKASAALNALVEDAALVKFTEKRVTYFKVATAE